MVIAHPLRRQLTCSVAMRNLAMRRPPSGGSQLLVPSRLRRKACEQ